MNTPAEEAVIQGAEHDQQRLKHYECEMQLCLAIMQQAHTFTVQHCTMLVEELDQLVDKVTDTPYEPIIRQIVQHVLQTSFQQNQRMSEAICLQFFTYLTEQTLTEHSPQDNPAQPSLFESLLKERSDT